VSFLAGVFADKLRKHQPELGITEQEVLCCKVAGLCHDLGHGVLSHSFDAFAQSHDPDWTHEKGSLLMLDYLLHENPGAWVTARNARAIIVAAGKATCPFCMQACARLSETAGWTRRT
jgi:HD superfamily phosphohydrolase